YLLAVIQDVVDRGLDGLVDRFPLDDLNHGQLLRLRAQFRSRHIPFAPYSLRAMRRPRPAGRLYRAAPGAAQSAYHTDGALTCRYGKPEIGKPKNRQAEAAPEHCCLKRRMRNVLLPSPACSRIFP